MCGYLKYFENGGKNMSFVVKNDDALDKYNELGTRYVKNNKKYAKNQIS